LFSRRIVVVFGSVKKRGRLARLRIAGFCSMVC